MNQKTADALQKASKLLSEDSCFICGGRIAHSDGVKCPVCSTIKILGEDHKSTESKIKELEEMLLNAFQLVKNGRKISHLKFEDFKELMKKSMTSRGGLNEME